MNMKEMKESTALKNVKEFADKGLIFESLIQSDANFRAFFQLPLVRDMTDRQAMVLFSCMTKKEFKAGDLVYQAGTASAGEMYLLLEGKVNVKNESGYKYSSLRQGDVFGLFSFLDEKRSHSATISVERDIVVLTLERSYFDLIALEEPKLGNQLMHFMFSLLSKKALELEVEYAHMHNFAFGGKV